MRIQGKKPLDKRLSPGGASSDKTGAVVYTDTGKDFRDALDQQDQSHRQADLDALLKRLDELGQSLAKYFSVYDLKSYKDTLRDFLRDTYGQAYGIRAETVLSKRGKTKVFRIIERIDRELEELSALVLSKHKDQVKTLAKLDQIRGLLVDLYS